MTPCPICRKKGDWFKTPHGPFCSPRCKRVDLARWLGEEYRFSSPLSPDHIEDLPEEPPPPHSAN